MLGTFRPSWTRRRSSSSLISFLVWEASQEPLQLAKVDVASLIVIEVDPDCRRLHRRRWPGCHCLGDIKKVSKKQMMDLVRKVPGVTGIIGGGGSPCQGLSRLSSEREHLSDPRSALFYDLKDRLKWIQEIGVELDIWTIRFCGECHR